MASGSFHIEPTISKLAEEIYLDEGTADVYFIFKSISSNNKEQEVRVPAHKIFLKLRSDVFGAMFYGELREKGDVEIVDATADAFKQFLKTFYFDKPDIEMSYIPQVLQLARKYNVEGCRTGCDRLLQRKICSDNVCYIYDLALEFQLPSTRNRCEQHISFYATKIFPSSNFLERSYENVLQIVRLNNFNCDEFSTFKACLAWAREECRRKGVDSTDQLNLRNQLQGILYQIRFLSMSSEHIGDVITQYHHLFTHDELADLALLAIDHSDSKTLLSKEYRNFAWNTSTLRTCSFVDIGKAQKIEFRRLESVTFSSNKEFVLRQIALGSLYVDRVKVETYESRNLKLQIIEKSEDVDEIEDKVFHYTSRQTASAKFGCWHTLPKMILIRPNIKYEIRLEYWDNSGNRYFSYTRDINDAEAHVVVEDDNREKIKIKITGRGTAISAIRICSL